MVAGLLESNCRYRPVSIQRNFRKLVVVVQVFGLAILSALGGITQSVCVRACTMHVSRL